MFFKCIVENEIIFLLVVILWMLIVYLSISIFKIFIGFFFDKWLLCRICLCVDLEIFFGRGRVWEIILFDGDSLRFIFDNFVIYVNLIKLKFLGFSVCRGLEFFCFI